MRKSFKFRYVNEITGAFVIVVVTLFLASVLFMGRPQGWFTATQEYKLILPEEGSGGLRPGGDVRILDTVVGTVESIKLNKQTLRMEATINVREDFAQLIRKDSPAYVRKSLLGDAFVEIMKGSGPLLAEPTNRNPEIVVTPEEDTTVEETLKKIQDEIVPAMQEARKGFEEYKLFAADLRKPDSSFQQALAHINNVVATVERGEGLAGKLLTDKAMSAEMDRTIAKVNQILDETRGVVQDVRKTTTSLSTQTDQTFQQIQAITRNIEATTATLPETARAISSTSKELPGLVLQMQETMRQIQRLVEGLQNNWLIRGGMEADKTGARIRPEEIDAGRR